MKFRCKYLKAVSMYRVSICLGLFVLFVSFVTLLIYNGIKYKRYEVGLKKSVYVLSEALVFVNFLTGIEEVENDAYYIYMLDTLYTRFDSVNCRYTKKSICNGKPYKTSNGKAMMSDLIFDKGEKIVIGNILYMLNKPVTPTEPLIVIVDTNSANIEPNRLGYDVFVFQIVKKRLRAMGNKGTLYSLDKYAYYCTPKSLSKDRLLGVNCTYEALTNPKYFANLK